MNPPKRRPPGQPKRASAPPPPDNVTDLRAALGLRRLDSIVENQLAKAAEAWKARQRTPVDVKLIEAAD